jgi:hypothetical protein
MPAVCNFWLNPERTDVGDVAVRCFQFHSVSTEIHCKTSVGVGKEETPERVVGNFDALPSCTESVEFGQRPLVCKQHGILSRYFVPGIY